ncbi:hypothetical protein [uncultured Agrobacterium sp.]|nr:hypothetical protein [uncultured Agrobacterium sp.]
MRLLVPPSSAGEEEVERSKEGALHVLQALGVLLGVMPMYRRP